MHNAVKLLIVVALAGAVGGAIALKGKTSANSEGGQAIPVEQAGEGDGSHAPGIGADAPFRGLPRFLDLGAGNCVPCKMMMPILEELRAEYEGSHGGSIRRSAQ